ncbi:MAG: GAF domain-containing protein, partial [Anaerolineae bacterium]|nr:GAF domain-containing protein [Anaerolineae bacterium]
NLAIQLGEFVQNLEKQNIELGVRGAEMEASQRVTFAASERTTPGDLLNLVVNLIRDQFDLYHAQVYMLNEEKDTAVLQESTGYAGRVLLQRNHQIPMEQASLVTSSIRTKEPVLVAETAKDSNWLPNELLPETKSELVVPLLLEGEVLGALDIQSREPGYFTERSVPIFQQMMNQVAFLFENSELVEEITAQTQTLEAFADQLRTAADIGSRLATILEPNRLLTEAVNQLQDRFGYYHAHIYLVDAEGENLEMAAGAGEVGRVLKERGHTIPMDREGSMVATAARNRAPVVANDVTKNPDHLPNPLLPDTRAEVAIPLISGESLVGVLDVQSEQVNRFPSANVDTLLTLGGQIASSVQNATLFRAAETATARVTNLVESAPAAIITMDQRQNIVFFNPGATQIFGYTPEEAIGKPLTFLMPERAHGVHNQEVEGFRREEVATRFMSSRRDIAGRRKDGTVFPAEAGISKMEIDGEVLYTAFLYDITERKSAQEAIVQGDRLKSDFLANMSHELRTPLNSIIGYTDVLLMGLDGELDEEIVTDVQAIHDNGQHLLSLINDILDLAKIEAGRMTLDVSPVDVTGLLEEIKKNAAGLLFNKPVEMLVETSDNLPMINGDRHRLYQVVTNLVSNAVKFTDEGSITLRAYQDNGHVVMEVADTGVGIAPDALDEIFEEFTQADTSSTRQYEGTGLGLTITRRLVRMHQGEISVASELGRGSTFALRIPTNPQFDPEHVSQMPAGQSTNGSM